MGNDYVTVHGILTAATQVYVALNTGTDGGTPGPIKVPQGRNRISALITSFAIDGALTVDVGNIGIIKLSGKALPQGDQEFVIGEIQNQETGTSVGLQVNARPAFRHNVSISVIGGNDLTVYGSYTGTDAGSQIVTVCLEFSTGSGPTANYYTRADSMGQATTTYNAIETTAENATSAIVTDKSASRITQIWACAIINAAAVDTDDTFVLKISGTGMAQQEIPLFTTLSQKGAGTITDTSVDAQPPVNLPINIDIRGGNSLSLAGAYVGTDPGTPFIAVTLEIF